MGPETRDAITWVLATTLAVCAVVGMLVRWVLLPYLREHLVEPMKTVKKQVTENHHSNHEPTVLDHIDDVGQQIESLRGDLQEMQKDYVALAGAMGKHLNWSEEEVWRLWRAIRSGPSAWDRGKEEK